MPVIADIRVVCAVHRDDDRSGTRFDHLLEATALRRSWRAFGMSVSRTR
jgi:hypothetical protein